MGFQQQQHCNYEWLQFFTASLLARSLAELTFGCAPFFITPCALEQYTVTARNDSWKKITISLCPVISPRDLREWASVEWVQLTLYYYYSDVILLWWYGNIIFFLFARKNFSFLICLIISHNSSLKLFLSSFCCDFSFFFLFSPFLHYSSSLPRVVA